MSKLSPGVNYEVVFVVMIRENSRGWDTPVELCLELPNGQRLVQEVILETIPKSKWIEIQVGDFETPEHPGDQETEVNFLMTEHGGHWKKGLVIGTRF
ncbi:hypothetical protein MKW94_020954 [Papaver nudicaule]|uniref:Phloem protein 2 n=1 Tax=Papaver nudicaule TaxID=74823 RepID=A0AA41SFW6_PAPNU|nr:hypothetical protein [Papaver nudicaule]